MRKKKNDNYEIFPNKNNLNVAEKSKIKELPKFKLNFNKLNNSNEENTSKEKNIQNNNSNGKKNKIKKVTNKASVHNKSNIHILQIMINLIMMSKQFLANILNLLHMNNKYI